MDKLSWFRVSQNQLILDWGDALIDINDVPAPSPDSKTPEESTSQVNLETAMGKSTLCLSQLG